MEEQADDDASQVSDTIELFRSSAFASNVLRWMLECPQKNLENSVSEFVDLFHQCCRTNIHENWEEAEVVRKFFSDLFEWTKQERDEYSLPVIEAFCEELQDFFDDKVLHEKARSCNLAVWLLDIICENSSESMWNKMLTTSLGESVFVSAIDFIRQNQEQHRFFFHDENMLKATMRFVILVLEKQNVQTVEKQPKSKDQQHSIQFSSRSSSGHQVGRAAKSFQESLGRIQFARSYKVIYEHSHLVLQSFMNPETDHQINEDLLLNSFRIFNACTRLDNSVVSKSLIATDRLVRTTGSNRKIINKIRAGDLMSDKCAETLLSCALEAMRNFASSHPEVCEQVARDLFVDLCMDESLLSLLPLAARNRVIEQSISCLCSLINQGKGSPSASSNYHQEIIELVHSIASVVFTDSDESAKSPQTSSSRSQRGGVLVLGALSSRIHNSEVMDIIHRLFMEGLQSLPSTLHENLLLHLTGIALVPPHKYLSSVIDYMVGRYSRPFDSILEPSAIVMRREIPRCFERLASGLTTDEALRHLQQELLVLIAKLGLSLQGNFTGRKQPNLKSDALQILGALLPSLATCFSSLAGSLSFSSSSSPQRADSLQSSYPKLCRTFVLYMTQHGLVDDVSPPTCLRPLKTIAQQLPQLLFSSTPLTSELERELDEHLRISTQMQESSMFRQKLEKELPARYKEFLAKDSKMTEAKCLQLMAIYHVERLRAIALVEGTSFLSSASFPSTAHLTPCPPSLPFSPSSSSSVDRSVESFSFLFSYFGAVSSEPPNFSRLLEGLFLKIIDKLTERFDSLEFSPPQEEFLTQLTCALILHSSSCVPSKRSFSEKSIKVVLRVFPILHWSLRCFRVLMDSYEESVNFAKIPLDLFSSRMTAESKLGDGGDFSQRHAALRVIENLVRYWMEQMLLQAPLASSAIIQIYLLQCSSPAGSEGVQSYTVNIIQEAMIGVMPLPHGAKAGGVAGAGGGRALNRMPNSDATSLQGLRGGFVWRYLGGWAVHGGVDFADVARGLQDKARYLGMAKLLLDLQLSLTSQQALTSSDHASLEALEALVKECLTRMQRFQTSGDVDFDKQGYQDAMGTLTASILLLHSHLSPSGLSNSTTHLSSTSSPLVWSAISNLVRSPFMNPMDVGARESMRTSTSLWCWINSLLSGTEREMLVREVCNALSSNMEEGCGLLSSWNDPEHHAEVDQSTSSRVFAECYAQALCVEFLQEQCRLSHKSKSIVFRSICKLLLLAFSRSRVLVLNEFNSALVLQLLRLAFIVLHEARMPSFLASILLDRTLSASLHFFSFRPSWGLDGKRDGTGNGPGVLRSRGAWIVVSSWMGRIRSAEKSREEEPVGFGMTQVHLLIQLGVSIQVLFKGRGGADSIFSTVRDWENSDEKEGEWLGMLDHHNDHAASSGFGYESSKLVLEELWQMPSESNSELFSEGRNAEDMRSSIMGGRVSKQSLSNSEQASIYSRQLPAMFSAEQDQSDPAMILKARCRLLVMFISSQVRRISVWHNPRNVGSDSSALEKSFLKESSIRQSWALNVRTAWNFEPELAFDFYQRYRNAEVFDELKKCLLERPMAASSLQGEASCCIAAAVLSSMNVLSSKHALAIMRPVSMLAVMKIIRDSLTSSQDLKNDPSRRSTDSLQPHIARYVANCLLHECSWNEANSQELFLCLPQLLQVALRHDKSHSILLALQCCARKHRSVRRAISPLLRLEMGISFELFYELYKKVGRNDSSDRAFRQSTQSKSLGRDVLNHIEKFFDFSDVIEEESCLFEIFRTCHALNVVDHASRCKYFINGVQAIVADQGSNFTMTTCSESVTICGIVSDSMIRDVQEDLAVDQSTVVAGFLTSTSSQGGGEQQLRWCLIEMNTNTRQQILTSQFINAMKLLLARGQVEIILAARNCLPFAEDRAVIELQLNFSERTIKNHDGAISHRFEAAFGPSHSPTYQAARASFIQSYAGSFLLSYFLHVKDQSNRLVFDDNGVHCLRDIFFPLDPAPASSDRTALRLPSEVISFLGGHGKGNVEPFKYLCNLIVKGFLVVREQQDFFVSLVSTFLQRHPHLKRDCLDQLRDKFLPGKTEREAASYMMDRVRESQEGTSVSSYEILQASLWANEAEN